MKRRSRSHRGQRTVDGRDDHATRVAPFPVLSQIGCGSGHHFIHEVSVRSSSTELFRESKRRYMIPQEAIDIFYQNLCSTP